MLFLFAFNLYRLQNVMEYSLKRSFNVTPSSTKELHRSNSVLSKNVYTRYSLRVNDNKYLSTVKECAFYCKRNKL